MSIQSELDDMKSYLSAAFDAVSEKGGTVPTTKNLTTLTTAIESI